MISVAEAISDLLFVRDIVVVPGLGAFVKKPMSAQVDLEHNVFSMPYSEIGFDASLREDNDIIIKYLVHDLGISENEAKRMVFHFVSESFKSLKAGKKVVLKNIGTLSFGPTNELVFEQDLMAHYNTDSFGLGDFKAVPIVRDEVKEEKEEKTQPPFVDNAAKELGHSVEDEEDEEDETRRLGWFWVVPVAVLVLGGLIWLVRSHRQKAESVRYVPAIVVSDTVRPAEPLQEEPPVDTIVQVPEEYVRIIAGCYDTEDFAQRMVNSLKNKGFPDAFMELHGERWFVAYGSYPTEEEALAVLREIRESGKGKGWILK